MRELLQNFLRTLYRANPVLAVTGWIHWALFAACILAYPFDSRTILGISPWIKPMKFSISIAIYVWTLAWYLRYLAARRRTVAFISGGVAVSMFVEIACITLQSARGVASHFNVATGLDAVIFSVMGGMIGFNALLILATLILFCFRVEDLPPTYLWGIRLGFAIFLLACAEGALMVVHGGHTVGAADGGPGLPLVNWSTQHGDLRIAHFAGVHALQILPLAGYWIGQSRLREPAQLAALTALSLLYLGAVADLYWIARLGRAVLSF